MKKINKKHLFSLFFLVVAGSCFVLSFIFFREIQKTADHLFTEKRELQHLSLRIERSHGAMSHKEMNDLLNQAYELFADPKNPIKKVIFFEDLAKENDLLVKIDVQEIIKGDPWPHFLFKINLSGSSSGIFNFLNTTESEGWLYLIDSLAIDKNNNLLIAEIITKIYFLDEDGR